MPSKSGRVEKQHWSLGDYTYVPFSLCYRQHETKFQEVLKLESLFTKS